MKQNFVIYGLMYRPDNIFKKHFAKSLLNMYVFNKLIKFLYKKSSTDFSILK